jgi:hypothetical protein
MYDPVLTRVSAARAQRRDVSSMLLLGLSRIESEDFLSQRVDLYDYDSGDLHPRAQFLANFSKANEPR